MICSMGLLFFFYLSFRVDMNSSTLSSPITFNLLFQHMERSFKYIWFCKDMYQVLIFFLEKVPFTHTIYLMYHFSILKFKHVWGKRTVYTSFFQNMFYFSEILPAFVAVVGVTNSHFSL